jgi:hypothetical protein
MPVTDIRDTRRFRSKTTGMVFRIEWQTSPFQPDGPFGLQMVVDKDVRCEVRGPELRDQYEMFHMSSQDAPSCRRCGGEKIPPAVGLDLVCTYCDKPKGIGPSSALPPLPSLEADDAKAMASATIRDTLDMVARCPSTPNWWRDRAERMAQEVIRLRGKVAAYEVRTMEGRTR